MTTPSTTTREHPPLIEIESDSEIRAIAFSANGEYLVGGGEGVRVWRVKDGELMARMEAGGVQSLAVSKDGKWIAAGTTPGDVYVLDANTYERAFSLEEETEVNGIDFSPDSTRLATGTDNCTLSVWDVATRQRVLGPLEHERYVTSVKYSPQGDRIATTTYGRESVRIYDSNDGRLLMDIRASVFPWHNSGLLWSKDQLFIVTSNEKIKRLDASTGSIISQWAVSDANRVSCICLPQQGEFIAYSSGNTIAFFDTEIRTQLGLIQRNESIVSLALSPDDRFVAFGEDGTKITINSLSRIVVPFIDAPDVVLGPWEKDRLADVETLLTRKIASSEPVNCYALANRALVLARLGRWDAAIDDAEKSIQIQPSAVGYIARSVALIGKGNKEEIRRVYDLAFRHVQSNENDPLLLIKAVVVFMAGDHDDAISRVDDLIATLPSNSTYFVIQAYMYLLRGHSQMENNNYEGAIQSYECAQAQMRVCVGPCLRTIALISGWKFNDLGITIRQSLCEALYAVGRTKEAGESLVEVVNSFDKEVYVRGSITKWVSDFTQRYIFAPEDTWVHGFKLRCIENLLRFGDAAADTQQHDDAITHYSAAMSLDPPIQKDIFIKRSKARAASGLWEDALDDANKIIALDPSSPQGFERKYVALGVAGHQKDMSDAFGTMLSKMAQSPDPEIRELRHQFPKTQETIRKAVQDAIRESPAVLINTTSGRLCDKSEQAVAFELSPTFAELTSSMTAQMDHTRIKRDVTKYYRYATFSHKLEFNEPLFEEVINMAVYELEISPTHNKLQTFCKIVRDAGYHWAWSSTCCIDGADHSALQAALVSMFRWYQESAMTAILLFDVCSPSQRGDLVNSVWNSRTWLFQEYHASKVVRFYNEDWTLYRNIDVPNHKESPEIISEIEEATGTSVKALAALRPGLGNIREKLRLASRQQTTLVEDAAYSLFGIFSVSLPVIYGEGDKALGHLLSQLLTNSRDTSILAWTGESGSFNSCLPSHLTVFQELSTSHVEPAMEGPEVDAIIASLRASSSNLVFLTKLNDRLNDLHSPWFAGQEMKLPCITFKLGPVSASQTSSGRVFHSQTAALGVVEIETDQDLSQFESLYLTHPWIDFLLNRPPVGNARETADEDTEDESSGHDLLSFTGHSNVPLAALQKRASRLVARLKRFSGRHDAASPELPSSQTDKQTQAVRFAVRLRQPFDALLLTPDARNAAAYRRVASQSRITVQVEDINAPILKQLVDGVRVLDVL